MRIIILLISASSYCQSSAFDVFPEEEIFINTNTQLFVSGETLFYNINCFEKNSDSLSSISKIAYILLINDSKSVVFKHKVILNNGLAFGDYYIPSNLKTGNYKLVTYTNWMKNNHESPFSQTDIYIINPFIKNKKTNHSSIDSVALKEILSFTVDEKIINSQLYTDKSKYSTRSKVILNLNKLKKDSINTNFSLSIRQMDSLKVFKNKTKRNKFLNNKSVKKLYLPEIKGEIITGKVFLKETNKPVSNKTVALSIKGNPTIFKSVKTNNFGQFYFNLYENYQTNKLIIQVVDDFEKYYIKIDDSSFEGMDQLQFNSLYLDKNIQNWLINKSIHNQIESAYFEFKKDTTIESTKPKIFYGKPSNTYKLDDYTRFPTVKDVFVEIISYASIRRRDGKQKFVLFTPESQLNKQFENLNSLVLIDGTLIQNHETLLDLNPNLIDKIDIVFEKYFLGPKIYDGIIYVKTYNGDFSLNTSIAHYSKQLYSPIKHKYYYSPDYTNKANDLKNIPDFRSQLVWNPNLNINDNISFFEFYTSDIKGIYEIVLSGYTKEKKFVKMTSYFKVE